MDRGEYIVFTYLFVDNDGILVVVTLPRHEGNQEVLTDSQLTTLGRVTLRHDLTLRDTLSARNDRAQVDRGALVGLSELRDDILLQRRVEVNELLILGSVVTHLDDASVDEFNDTVTLSGDLST